MNTDIFIKSKYLNLSQIARSGQCFRWKRMESGGYFVISDSKAACFFQQKTGIRMICRQNDEAYFRNYLDLNTDYAEIIEEIDRADTYLYDAAQMGQGIRILKQELWETIVSFIISQRSSILRIMKSIDCLCEQLGDKVFLMCDGKKICGHAFPQPEQIVHADLSACKFGYRERYVRQAAEDVLSGVIRLDEIAQCGENLTENAQILLKKIVGVGDKVASCIQLFGLHQLSVFPVDTWIHKMEAQHYGGHFPAEQHEKYAGVMQQYLFFRMREEENRRAELAMMEQEDEIVRFKKTKGGKKTAIDEVDSPGCRNTEAREQRVLAGKTLYVSDLDGTLLNEKALLPEGAAGRLNRLAEQGLCFTVATARTPATANPILKDLNLKYPMILMNGVMIYDPVKKSCIDAEIIEPSSVEYIIRGRKQFGVTGFVYTLFGEETEQKMCTYYENLATPHMHRFYEERKINYDKVFIKADSLEDIEGEDVIYFSFCYEEEVLRPYYEYLTHDPMLSLSFYKDVYDERLWYLEISHKNASKYHGVEKLRRLLHPDRIVGIGDNLNDIPMFEACDSSCAVGNARGPVKEAADRIVDTNLDMGVVKYLENEIFK